MTSDQQNGFYAYSPSIYLALVAIILFSALTSIMAFRMVQTRSWESIFFVLGGLAQLSGYIARVISTQDVNDRAAYGLQSVLLLLGPTLLMFSINLTQVSFAQLLGAERFCWVPVFAWKKRLYLILNSILMVIQAIGGTIVVAASSSTVTIGVGTKITIAVYIIQLLFWVFTMAENIYMSVSLSRHPTEQTRSSSSSGSIIPNWKRWNQLFGLGISIIALGRNVMRLTMAAGVSFLVDNEWPCYAFDGYQMAVVLGAWTIFYLPGKCKTLACKNEYHNLALIRRAEDEETIRGT